jgi:hypothetical protein
VPIHSARATRASSSARTPPRRNTFWDAHAPRLSPKTQISAPDGARVRSSSSSARCVRAAIGTLSGISSVRRSWYCTVTVATSPLARISSAASGIGFT